MGTAPPSGSRLSGQMIGAGLAIGAALALCGISATLNYRFGFSLGRTESDGQVYGLAAVCADGLKALAPFMVFAAWRTKARSHFAAALAVWAVTTAFALAGAVGHLSLNRTEVTAKREVASTNYSDLRDEQKRLKQQIAWIPQHRAAASIEADMAGQRLNRIWTATNACADATAPASREFCAGYQRLAAELGSAKETGALQHRLDALTDKLGGLGGAVEADPQAQALSRLSSIDVAMVQTLLMLLFVGLLEIGSGLAPYAAVALMRAAVPVPATEIEIATHAATVSVPSVAVVETVAAPATETATKAPDKDDGPLPPPAPAVLKFRPLSSIPSASERRAAALSDIKRVLATVGVIPAEKVLAQAWGVEKWTVNRWLRSTPFQAVCQRERVGKCIRITGVSEAAAA